MGNTLNMSDTPVISDNTLDLGGNQLYRAPLSNRRSSLRFGQDDDSIYINFAQWMHLHVQIRKAYLDCENDENNILRLIAPELRVQIPEDISDYNKIQEKYVSVLNIRYRTKLDNEKKISVLQSQLSSGLVLNKSQVKFVAVGMRFRGGHVFSEGDEITLEKEDDNLHDSNAIKILVQGKHVAYVVRNDAIKLRGISKFEENKVKFVRMFAASAELTMEVTDESPNPLREKYHYLVPFKPEPLSPPKPELPKPRR
jgi:hypothetical protein